MHLLPSDDDLLSMFDTYCKKVLKISNFKLLKEEQRRRERGYVFSDLEENFLEQYYVVDEYPALLFWINIKDLKVSIESEMLYNALLLLPKKRLEIIMLSFFMEMTDVEIGKIMSLPRTTVRYNRVAALQELKRMMEVVDDFNET